MFGIEDEIADNSFPSIVSRWEPVDEMTPQFQNKSVSGNTLGNLIPLDSGRFLG